MVFMGLNQFFLFRKISMVPSIFSDLSFGFKSIDKTCIEYAIENYGKNIVFNLPFDMVDSGEFIRSVYPFSISIGLIDDLSRFDKKILERLEFYDYIVLCADSIDKLIGFRGYLKKLMHIRPGFKRLVILRIASDTTRDDLVLFLDMSGIYGYRPVLRIEDEKILDHVKYLVNLGKASHCTTKWFNYNVYIYFIKDPGINGPLTILMPCQRPDVELIMFKDCMAFLCHGHGQVSMSSIIRFIYENSKPLLRIGDVIVDDEFLLIAESLNEYKSIRATSKSIGLSYTRIRRVIKELEKIEKMLGVQLIEAKRGGSEHGKTSYTHVGKIVMDNIKELYSELVRAYSSVTMNTLEELRKQRDKPICIFPLSV